MKRIVTYKVFESKRNEPTPDQVDFLNRCTDGIWNYNAVTGLVDVEGDFDGSKEKLENMHGIKFGKVSGYFYCEKNRLTSLKGAPQEVGGNFNCSDNVLKSLVGAPQKVGGSFLCVSNNLISLAGSPQKVGGTFNCTYNDLTSLEGAPQEVGEDFVCNENKLMTLAGAPRKVGGRFSCDAFQSWGGEWNLKGWLEILQEGEPDAQKMIMTILPPKVMNREIQKDPTAMIKKLKNVWNEPDFQNMKKSLKFPAEFGDVDKMVKSLNKFDDIKGFI